LRDAQPPALRLVALGISLALVSALVLATITTTAVKAQAILTVDEIYVVAGTGNAGLTLRDGPGFQHATLGVLPEGTSVHILNGPISDGSLDWYQIEIQGAGTLGGYSIGTYLRNRDEVVADAAIVAPPGSRTFTATVTGYANGSDGGAVGSYTASGTRTHWGTVAADTSLYPMGTRLLIEGFEGTVFVVEDTGSGVHGDLFDIWFPDVATAVRFGTQWRTVTILPPGS